MPPVTSVIHSDPEILGGTPVFVGTRVPLQNLIDYLAAGDPMDEFLDQFPSVSREQAVAALSLAPAARRRVRALSRGMGHRAGLPYLSRARSARQTWPRHWLRARASPRARSVRRP